MGKDPKFERGDSVRGGGKIGSVRCLYGKRTPPYCYGVELEGGRFVSAWERDMTLVRRSGSGWMW
jgi:hypothetical protein